MVLSMSEQVAMKIRSKNKIIKQLDKRLQNAVTPDPTKEISIEDRLKNLKKRGKDRRQSQLDTQNDETNRATATVMSTRRTTVTDYGGVTTLRSQS